MLSLKMIWFLWYGPSRYVVSLTVKDLTLPDGTNGIATDNILIAFNVIPIGEDGMEAETKGTMPRYIGYKCTDYEYALNTVAPEYGGGFEIWRMLVPGMPRKHFYPRQPKSSFDGAVKMEN